MFFPPVAVTSCVQQMAAPPLAVTAQAGRSQATDLLATFQLVSLPLTLKVSGAGGVLRQYLLVPESLRAFDLALPVVLHDHHGGVDFPHCQVCGC